MLCDVIIIQCSICRIGTLLDVPRDALDTSGSIKLLLLGRCLQHRGGKPERAKGADGMQLFALDCIAYIVDAETNSVFACMNDM